MHNAVYSNQGRPFSPSQGRPFSPTQPLGPGRPFSPSSQDGLGRPFSPSGQDGPGRPFSPSQQPVVPGRPFSPSRQEGPPSGTAMSGVAISKPFPGDQRTDGSRTPGPTPTVSGAAPPGGSPGLKPKVMPKPTLPSFLADQLNTGQSAQPQPQPPAATGAVSAQKFPQHKPMMGTQYVQQQQQHQQQQPRAPASHVQQQPQPRMGAAAGSHYPVAPAHARQQQQPQQAQYGGGTGPRARYMAGQAQQSSPYTEFGTQYLPKQQQQQQQPQKEPVWMWSMKDMLPLNLQQNREFAPCSMPASPTSPGPDQWASQPYSLPTSPTPISAQNIGLAPPEERMNAPSPVRQMAALFDRESHQPQGGLHFVARKRLQPWKKPSVSLAGKQNLSPLGEPGRAYSPTTAGRSQPPSSAASAQPTPSFPRVLSPSVDTSQPSRVLSPTRQIQQVSSTRVMSPTQQMYTKPGDRVLSPTRQLVHEQDANKRQQQRQIRVFSPTRQLVDNTSQQQRVLSPTRHLQAQPPEFGRVFSPTKQLEVSPSPPMKKAGVGVQQQQQAMIKPTPISAPSRKTPTPTAQETLSAIERRQPYMMALQPPSILKQARDEKYRETNKRIEEALAPKGQQGHAQGHQVHFSDSTNFSVGGPVNRPITPFSQDKEPWQKTTTALDRPVTPLDRPTTPYEGLKRLFDRPTTPYERPITPYGKPGSDRPTTPIFVQVDGFEKPTQRPVTPLDRPTTPLTNPLVRPTYGKDRPTTPLERPTGPIDTHVSSGNYQPYLSMDWTSFGMTYSLAYVRWTNTTEF